MLWQIPLRWTIVAILAAVSVMPPPRSHAQQTVDAMPANPALHNWQQAQAVVLAAAADVKTFGLMSLQRHVPDLERALAAADRERASLTDGAATIAFTDGLLEMFLVAANARRVAVSKEQKIVFLTNPYPNIAMLLGSYYVEARQYTEAVRVLDAALALPSPDPGDPRGATRPDLMGESGVALCALQRLQDALQNYDDALRLGYMTPLQRARMLRGRGVVLTDLGRLDEGEEAYRASLAVEPNNQVAERELRYIAGLRSGQAAMPLRQVRPNAGLGQ